MLVVSVARRLGSGGETVVCASVRLTASPKGQLGTEAAMNSFHHRCASARPTGHRFALTRRDLLATTAAGLVRSQQLSRRAPFGQSRYFEYDVNCPLHPEGRNRSSATCARH